jgi:hypothetical protein
MEGSCCFDMNVLCLKPLSLGALFMEFFEDYIEIKLNSINKHT